MCRSEGVGGVTLVDNITVAAGAVVVRSCMEKNAILAGVPAKIISYNVENEKYLQ